MKRVFVLMGLCLSGVTSFANVIVYYNDYEDAPVGNLFPFPEVGWNWGGDICDHTAVYADYGGNVVVEHTGAIDNTTGTVAAYTRFGSKWDITPYGNTSSNPADYTIEFDIWNVSGNWDPIDLELFVLTYNPKVGTDTYGWGTGALSFSQLDGWVHVEGNLADLFASWWQGYYWDLTSAAWSIEVGGPPWPGTLVEPGDAWNQVWLFDNLKITMVPEPASLVLLGLGSLAVLRVN